MKQEIFNKLFGLYNKATFKQRHLGNLWYNQANLDAQNIQCKLSNDGILVELPKVIGVISALSPNNKWERNLLDAELLIRKPLLMTKVCTYTANRVKALQILGSDNDKILSILGGRKTKSFYNNILNPFSDDSVTVDLWMYRGAELKQSPKNYELISDITKGIASLQSNVLPHQVQATIWSVLRN